jgi:hypothetical protein
MEWIKCSDKLPQKDLECLIYDINKQIYNACFNGQYFYTGEYDIEIEDVTHWMPLPEPPKMIHEFCKFRRKVPRESSPLTRLRVKTR